MSIAYVEEPGRAVIGPRGVTITYKSGSDVFVRLMAVADFRAFIAHGQQVLHEHDAAQRARVVPFRKGAQSGH